MTTDLLSSFEELLEICRVKCSPLDEPILQNGKSNHQALVDAVAALDRYKISSLLFAQMRETVKGGAA